MEEIWIQLLAILTLLTQTCSASDTTELIRAVGGSVTFHIPKTDGNGAFWSFGNVPIVTVPFKDPFQSFFYQDKFKTHFTVSEDGWALSISQLRMEDAGTYSVNIDGKISTFILLVYKELTVPTVTCEAQDCSDGRCNVSLRCSVTGTGFGNVCYTWRMWDQPLECDPVILVLVNKSSQDESELMCTARNAVSSRNVTITNPGGLCPDTLSHSGDRVKFGIIGITVVVVILLVFLVIFCKSQGWRKFHLSQSKPPNTATTGEFTTVYAEVGPSQQRIPNGIKAKPAAGESSSTIYSLVKRPELLESATVTGLELV